MSNGGFLCGGGKNFHFVMCGNRSGTLTQRKQKTEQRNYEKDSKPVIIENMDKMTNTSKLLKLIEYDTSAILYMYKIWIIHNFI